MNDLQQFQIKHCKLAIPNGLQELMSDISREVLRSQPNDLCNFIAEYLGALLEARDKLAIAAQICDEVCQGSCQPELEDELRAMGLGDEKVKLVGNIVQKYFEERQPEKGHETLIYELSMKIDVDESVLEAIVDAVVMAYRRHFVNNAVKYETSDDGKDDRATTAAKNAVKFYENHMFEPWETKTEELKENKREKKEIVWTNEGRGEKRSVASVSSMSLAGSHITLPKHDPYDANESSHDVSTLEEFPKKEEINGTDSEETMRNKCEVKDVVLKNEKKEKIEEIPVDKRISFQSFTFESMEIASSESLAGSFIKLSKDQPYDATKLSVVDETPEKEQMNLDYTMETDSKRGVTYASLKI